MALCLKKLAITIHGCPVSLQAPENLSMGALSQQFDNSGFVFMPTGSYKRLLTPTKTNYVMCRACATGSLNQSRLTSKVNVVFNMLHHTPMSATHTALSIRIVTLPDRSTAHTLLHIYDD